MDPSNHNTINNNHIKCLCLCLNTFHNHNQRCNSIIITHKINSRINLRKETKFIESYFCNLWKENRRRVIQKVIYRVGPIRGKGGVLKQLDSIMIVLIVNVTHKKINEIVVAILNIHNNHNNRNYLDFPNQLISNVPLNQHLIKKRFLLMKKRNYWKES